MKWSRSAIFLLILCCSIIECFYTGTGTTSHIHPVQHDTVVKALQDAFQLGNSKLSKHVLSGDTNCQPTSGTCNLMLGAVNGIHPLYLVWSKYLMMESADCPKCLWLCVYSNYFHPLGPERIFKTPMTNHLFGLRTARSSDYRLHAFYYK